MKRFIRSSNKSNKKLIKEYYNAGKDAYEIGHPEDPENMKDLPKELIDAYWRGFEDAQEEANEE